MSSPVNVETWTNGTIVYRLRDQSPAALTEWIRRVAEDLSNVRRAQRGIQGTPDLCPRYVIHDIRACGFPRGPLLSHLSVGLNAGRDLAICTAIVAADHMAVNALDRLLRIPAQGGSDTLPVPTREQVWSPKAVARFFEDFDEAVAWLSTFRARTGG